MKVRCNFRYYTVKHGMHTEVIFDPNTKNAKNYVIYNNIKNKSKI